MGYFAPLARSSTYARLTYLILGFPLGLAYFVFLVTMLSVSAGLAIVWVGIPLFLLTVLAWRAMAAFDRRLINHLVGVSIDDPPSAAATRRGLWQKTRAMLGDSTTWRSLVWLAFRFPLGVVGFAISIATLATAFALFVAPLIIVTAADFEGSQIDLGGLSLVFWLLPVIGLFVVPAGAHLVNGWALLEGQIGRALLGPTARQQQERLQRRTRVLEERTRLAHELHDSVGHTLTMMVVQAGAGRHVFDKDPQFSRNALENIETSGRRALAELDRILGILRDEESGAERVPRAGLEGIASLVEQTIQTGLPVELSMEGDTADVPAGVGQTTYRIVQEGLTNVIKHAGPVPTRVSVRVSQTAVETEIVNDASPDGNGASPVAGTGGGRGLAGIRERVAILGGVVETGPRAEGGYRLWAKLPRDGG
jgi:signal transduction histidine kinase